MIIELEFDTDIGSGLIFMKTDLDNLIKTSATIAITTHLRPDPDAVCSMLALYHYIKLNFTQKEPQMFITGEKIPEWSGLLSYEKINWVEDIANHLEKFDLVCLTDSTDFSRASNKQVSLSGKLVLIDHHETEIELNSALNLSDKTAAAATQIIAETLFAKDLASLPAKVLEIILFGILSDTGGLTFVEKGSERVLETVQNIVATGKVSIQNTTYKYERMSKEDLEVIKILIDNTNYYKPTNLPPLMYSYLSKSVLEEYSENTYVGAYHKFASQYLRRVGEYCWGFVVVPRKEPGLFGISFRSAPEGTNVRIIAGKFEGGGHNLASGGMYKTEDASIDSKQVCEKVLEIIERKKGSS